MSTEFYRRKFVQVTPDMARAWLEKNINNRPISRIYVEQYVREMRAGIWEPKRGVPVQITPEGNLGNGQHRLTAVIEFGQPVLMVVEYDVPLAESILADIARPKSLSDLRRQLDGVTNAKQEHAIARAVVAIATDNYAIRLGRTELEEVILENEDGMKIGLAGAKFRALVWGAVVFAYPVAPAKVRQFADQLVSGEGFMKGSPVMALRESLLKFGARRSDSRGGAGSSVNRVVASKCLAAIYKFIRNESLDKVLESDVAVAWFRTQRKKRGLDKWADTLRGNGATDGRSA